MFSHLKNAATPASRSKLCEFRTGVRRAMGRIRSAAARMSSRVMGVAKPGDIASLSITWHTGVVPDVCTCGAKLPPDARFCHKCGKPQRDEPVVVEEAEPPPPLPFTELPTSVPARISFHNILAVRVALMAGALGFCLFVLLVQVPGLQVLAILSPIASGAFAVHLYKRKTGQRLSMASGAHLGWISGIFGFLITTLMFTAFAVMLTNPELANAVRQQAGTASPEVSQALKEIQTAAGITKALLELFVLLTLLPTFGGSLGAKLLDRD